MLDRTDYDAIEGVNPSSLKVLWKQSPRHFLHALSHRREESPAMLLGTATHCAILEPEKFDLLYIVRPDDLDGRTKEGKAWLAENADRIVLKRDQWDSILGMRESIMAHPVARTIVVGGDVERPLIWTDEQTGIVCKGRPDIVLRDGTLVDLKTTRDGSPHKFAAQVADLGYHFSMAMYFDGLRANGIECPAVYLPTVETVAPYDVTVYELTEDVIDTGREEYAGALLTLAKCRASGVYPGRADDVVPLVLPRWAVNDEPLDDETIEYLKNAEG